MSKRKRIIDELKETSQQVGKTKRNKKVMFCLSDREYASLTKVSDTFGVTKQSLIHKALLNEGLLNMEEIDKIKKDSE